MVLRASDNRGFAALVGVLIFGGFAIAITSAMVYSGMRSKQSSLVLRQSYEAKAIGRACADTALRSIHDNTSYTGSGSVTLGTGSCTYTVTNGGGAVRTVSVTSTVGRITKAFTIVTSQVSPTIVVSSWREV